MTDKLLLANRRHNKPLALTGYASRSAPSRSAHLGEDESNCLEHPVV